MNDNLPSNSKKERREVQKVASGKKITKKKGWGRRVAEAVFGNAGESKLDIPNDIIKPAVENVAFDTISAITGAITDAFEVAIFKGQPSKSRRRRRSSGGLFDYNSLYRGGTGERVTILGSEDRRERHISDRARELQDFSEVCFLTMSDAKDVLETLDALIEEYDTATVADFYRAADVSSTYQDRKWGWTDLNGAYPTHTRDGYILVLPKPIYLK